MKRKSEISAPFLLLIAGLSILAAACSPFDGYPGAKIESDSDDEALILRVIGVDGNEPETKDPEIHGALECAASFFRMVLHSKLEELPKMVDPEAGVYVDLKARWNLARLKEDLKNPEGYLRTTYLDSDGLRKRTGDATQISLREILESSGTLDLNLFSLDIENGRAFEIKATPLERPGDSFRFNNGICLKKGSSWKIFRLF